MVAKNCSISHQQKSLDPGSFSKVFKSFHYDAGERKTNAFLVWFLFMGELYFEKRNWFDNSVLVTSLLLKTEFLGFEDQINYFLIISLCTLFLWRIFDCVRKPLGNINYHEDLKK